VAFCLSPPVDVPEGFPHLACTAAREIPGRTVARVSDLVMGRAMGRWLGCRMGRWGRTLCC
jgi:hypothetical protein